MIKRFYSLLNLFIAFNFYTQSIHSNEAIPKLSEVIFNEIDPVDVGILYQILKVTDLAMTEHDIKYWIEFGTLIGAVRHKGMLRWDDDADICIKYEDREKVMSIIPFLEKYGLELTVYLPDHLYKIHRKGIPFPWVDIFFAYYNVQYKHYKVKHCSPKIIWLEQDLYKMKNIQYGPLTLKAPWSGILNHLKRFYGTDIMENAIIWNHTTNGNIRIKAKIDDFSPAQYIVTEDIIDLD